MKDDLDLDQYLISSDDDDFSQYEIKKKKPFYKSGEIPEAFGRGGVAGVKSTPRTLAGLLKYGGKKLHELSERKIEAGEVERPPDWQRKLSEYAVKGLGYPEELLEKMGLPTYEEALESGRTKQGIIPEEMSGLEKGLETAGGFLGGGVLTPAASFGGLGRAGLSALAASGAGLASAAGGEEGAQLAGAIGLPALVKMIQAIKTGKFIPTGAEAKKLYEEGKKMGLTDKELTPILQPELKKTLIGSPAMRTKRAQKAIEASEGALGNLYEEVKSSTARSRSANTREIVHFNDDLQKIANNLKKSKAPGADKKQAIEKIEEMIADVYQNGIRPDEIIETWQDINKTVNWNSFRGGKKALAALKDPMGQLFAKLDPKNYKKFQTLNTMWSKLQDTAYHIKPKKVEKWFKAGEYGVFAASLWKLMTTGNPKVLAGLATAKGAQLLATEMLINPRLNNLMRKTITSVGPGTKASFQKAVRDFEKELRDFPEIHDEFDWNRFES